MSQQQPNSTSTSSQLSPGLTRSPLLQARSPASPFRSRQSPRIERRVSNHPPNWSLNDDSGPQQHHRAPSLGDLHQELESEQEGTVNRLLGQIRQQQTQLQQQSDPTQSSAATIPQLTPTQSSNSLREAITRSRTPSLSSARRPSSIVPSPAQPQPQLFRTPSTQQPRSLSRQSSHRSSIPPSPSLRPLPLESPSPSPSNNMEWNSTVPIRERDEVTFLQTEAASVQKENKMLEARVRELERLLGEAELGAA